jgi:hypothetical protein
LIDRDPLGWGEFRVDHLHRALRGFYLEHLVLKMNHRVPVNLHDVDLNLVLMDVMKDARLMDDQKMIHLKKDDRLMDDLNCLVDLNSRDALPCTHSLITM